MDSILTYIYDSPFLLVVIMMTAVFMSIPDNELKAERFDPGCIGLIADTLPKIGLLVSGAAVLIFTFKLHWNWDFFGLSAILGVLFGSILGRATSFIAHFISSKNVQTDYRIFPNRMDGVLYNSTATFSLH